MLDPNSMVPLYHQLKELLKEKIKKGSWKIDQKIPSEKELMEMYEVSRATARKALEEIMVEGLIYRKQGRGTFVSRSKVEEILIGELSFKSQVLKQGLTPSSTVVSAEEESNLPNHIRKVFQQNGPQKILKILRLRFVDDEPLILDSLFIPTLYASDILSEDLENINVFEYLEVESNLTFTHSQLDIEPIVMDKFLAKKLKMEIGSVALSLERIVYQGDKVIIFQRRIIRGDRGKFSLALGENHPNKKNNYIMGLDLSKSSQSISE